MSPKDSPRKSTVKTEIQTKIEGLDSSMQRKSSELDPCLIVNQGDQLGRVFHIHEGTSIIGRRNDCEIMLSQRSVSGHHAQIERRGLAVVLKDLESSNGTYYLGKKLEPQKGVVLRENDLIKIGNTVFRYSESAVEAEFAESLHAKSSRDSLTGVFNKEHLLKYLESAMDNAKSGFPLSLIMLDLDHFKKINDQFGHIAGDFVLKETCKILTANVVRGEDYLGRFGGEEFTVVLPDTDLKTAVVVAERVRSTIENHKYLFNEIVIPVTSSLGVSQWKPQYKTVSDFMDAADKLLYKSKQGGRNQVSS